MKSTVYDDRRASEPEVGQAPLKRCTAASAASAENNRRTCATGTLKRNATPFGAPTPEKNASARGDWQMSGASPAVGKADRLPADACACFGPLILESLRTDLGRVRPPGPKETAGSHCDASRGNRRDLWISHRIASTHAVRRLRGRRPAYARASRGAALLIRLSLRPKPPAWRIL